MKRFLAIYISTDDLGHRQVPRHAEQRSRVYEASRGAESFKRACHGLCRINVGHDQGIRHR